eukprot:3206236-Prymnesium_polylepis.1
MAVCKEGPAAPPIGADEEAAQDLNATYYNGMIAPWLPMAVRGALWYQGESNVACSDVWPYVQGENCAMSAGDCAGYYECQFPAMIADWRSSFAGPWQGTGVEL